MVQIPTVKEEIRYAFLHNLLNVLVQIANKMGLQKKKYMVFRVWELPT
jgi:hypothetical protein